MHGFVLKTSKRSKRSRQSSRRHFRGKLRAAAVRSGTAAYLHLGMPIPPPAITKAAAMTGSNPLYVMAMVTILKSEDWTTFNKVMRGDIPILHAAAMVRTRSKLVDAFRKATAADRIALMKTVGAEETFDEALAPAL